VSHTPLAERARILIAVMFKEALIQADEHDAKVGERIGDFWGLPSCFKGESRFGQGHNSG